MQAPNESTVIVALLGLVGIVVSNVVSFFSGVGKVKADNQTALNDAFTKLAKAYEVQREQDQKEILNLQGEVRQLNQRIDSLISFIRSKGWDVPRTPTVDVIEYIEKKDVTSR